MLLKTGKRGKHMRFIYSNDNYCITAKSGNDYVIKRESLSEEHKKQLINKKSALSKDGCLSPQICDTILNADNKTLIVSEVWFKDRKLFDTLKEAQNTNFIDIGVIK